MLCRQACVCVLCRHSRSPAQPATTTRRPCLERGPSQETRHQHQPASPSPDRSGLPACLLVLIRSLSADITTYLPLATEHRRRPHSFLTWHSRTSPGGPFCPPAPRPGSELARRGPSAGVDLGCLWSRVPGRTPRAERDTWCQFRGKFSIAGAQPHPSMSGPSRPPARRGTGLDVAEALSRLSPLLAFPRAVISIFAAKSCPTR